MFDYQSDFLELVKPIESIERYSLTPKNDGEILDILGDSSLNEEDKQKLKKIHGMWQIDPHYTAHLSEKYGLTPEQEFVIELAIENAILWGNKNDPSKSVEITFLSGKHHLALLKDKGFGFNYRQVQTNFENGLPYANNLGGGTHIFAKCSQTLAKYCPPGNKLELLFLNDPTIKPYFVMLDR